MSAPRVEKQKDHQSLLKTAKYYFNKKKWREAIDAYSQLINLEPENPSHHFNRGLCYASLGDWDRAIADVEEAVLKLSTTNRAEDLERAKQYLWEFYLNKSVYITDSIEIESLRKKAIDKGADKNIICALNYLDQIRKNSDPDSKAAIASKLVKIEISSNETIEFAFRVMGFPFLNKQAEFFGRKLFSLSKIMVGGARYNYVWNSLLSIMLDVAKPKDAIFLSDNIGKLKHNILCIIKFSRNKELRQRALLQALSQNTFIGKIFYFQNGIKKPSVQSGKLNEIAMQLQMEEDLVIDEKTRVLLASDRQLEADLKKHFPRLHGLIFSKQLESKAGFARLFPRYTKVSSVQRLDSAEGNKFITNGML